MALSSRASARAPSTEPAAPAATDSVATRSQTPLRPRANCGHALASLPVSDRAAGGGTLSAPADSLTSGDGPPPALLDQLAPGGRLVLPLREDGVERLVLFERDAGGAVRREPLEQVRFVPLV